MKIDLQGVSNARDLGGMAIGDKRIATCRLLRSGEHNRLTDSDKRLLADMGLQRVIDLRTPPEIANVPDNKIDGVQYEYISVIPATTFGISYETTDGATIAKYLQAGLERMASRGETPAEHMQDLYRRFAALPHCREKIGEFVRTLAHRPVDGATLWHCSAGKDRVGVCTATLLHCLGASRRQIVDDYMLTNTQTETSRQSILNKVAPHVSADMLQLVKQMLCVDESYIARFFDTAENLYGTFDNFVQATGVTEQDRELLKKEYLVE